jgi:TP901 family phage tail tape measure protein
MSDRQVRIILSGEAVSLIRAAGQAEGALRRVGSSGQQAGEQASSFGTALRGAAAAAGVVTGFAAVAGAIKYVVTQGTAFQDNMNSLQAVTGASAGQMDRLSGVARSLGKDIDLPATSAGDAAEAMLELAKGGLSVNQSMAAAKGTLLLAAAAQVSGAQAAEIQANALNAFALSGDQANHVADVLANTANAASGEITDFASGLAQSATVAHAFGIGIEDSATTLGLFAKAGLSGSDAGTSFKTMLTALASPTKQQQIALDELNLTVYDAQGQFVGMKSVTEQLAAAKGHLTQQEYNAAASTAFGSDAIRAANILAEGGVGAWNNMADAVGKAGGAQELAAAKTQGVSGAFGKMMSSVEDLSLTLFDKFAPALEGGLNGVASLVGGVGDAVTWFGALPAPVQAGAAALTALIVLKGPLASLWASMMASGVGLAVQGEMLAARLAMQSMRLEAAASGTSMSFLGAGMRVAGLAAVGLGNSLKAAFMSNPIGLALVAATTALTFFMSATDEAAGSTADFTGAIDENTGALSANAPAVIASASAKSGAFAAYKAIGGSVKEYTDALLGNTSAQDALHTRLLDTATAAVKGSAAWDRYVASGQSLGKSARETASEILATGDAGQFASSGLDAAMLASSMYASESDKLGTEATQMNDVIAATGGATDKAAGGLDKAGGAAATASSAMDNFKKATDGLTASATLADAAMQFLQADLDAASGHAISMEQATRLSDAAFRGIKVAADDYAAAQDNVTASAIKVREAQAKVDDVTAHLGMSQKDGGTTADDLTTAQLALADANRSNEEATGKVTDATDKQFDANIKARDAALKVATALYTNTAATQGVDAATQAATASLQTAKDAFIAAQPEADRLSGKANATADALFGIPKDTVAKISETGSVTVQGQAAAVKGAIDAIPGSKLISINADTGIAIREIGNLQQVINSVTGKSVTFTTNNVVNNIVRGTTVATPFAGGAVNDYVAAAKSKAAGFWGGGKLPGTAPADPTVDNLAATGPGGTPFRVRSNEWVISEPASKYYGDARMDAINNMTYPRLSQGAGTVTAASGGSQPINLTLTLLGDGPITDAALGAARVTVDGAMRDFALSVVRQAGQGT